MLGRNPTKAEKKWLDAITELGCIVCQNEFGGFSPASPHHIDGSRKKGAHFKTIPLCGRHHQVASDSGDYATRHGPGKNAGKTMFVASYGTEESLLEKTHELLGGKYEG